MDDAFVRDHLMRTNGLKQAVAEMLLKNRFLKKTLNAANSESRDI